MTEQPDAEIADLTLLDEDEQRTLLATFSTGPTVTDPASEGVLERLAAQVRQRPGQCAVVADDAELDYATLDRRANRLAHALIARGAGPDRVVGLHAGRTAELVIGVLGILKSRPPTCPSTPASPRSGSAPW